MLRLKSARAMLIAAMCAFGTLGPFVRNISVSSGELALYRAVMAALLLAGYLLLTGQRIEFKSVRKESVLLLVSGMAMGINWILLFEAYRYTTVSVATLSYYFAPVIVTAACPFLFHEKLTVKQVICFAMSTLGLVLVINVTGMGGGTDNIGVLFGVGAAVFYAAVILLNKFIKSVAGIQRTFLQFASAIVILVPYVACTSGVTLGALTSRGWVCLLVVGLFHTGVTYCLYFSALRELPGQEAALLSYIDPLVAVLVSVLILGEQITAVQLFGGLLILGFTLWNEFQGKR
ncbi:DMT family transporter [Dysosmobacter sp.]